MKNPLFPKLVRPLCANLQPPHSLRQPPPLFFSLPKTEKSAAINTLYTLLSLLKSTGVSLFDQSFSKPLKPEPSLCSHMAFNGKSSQNSGMSASGEGLALLVRRSSTVSSDSMVFGPELPSTGFETLPPRSILYKPIQFLKSICLKPVGLGFDYVPFHAGWELVEWRPTMSVSEWLETEFDRICDEIESEDPIEVVEPQIDLDLGEGSSINDDEPPVEVPRVVPTVVIEEEDSSVEILISGKEMKADQAEGIGVVPVPEDAELKREGQAVGTGEPVLDDDRLGEEPDLMEVDPAVRTGDVPV